MLKKDIRNHDYIYSYLTIVQIESLICDQIFRISIYFFREDKSKESNYKSEDVNKRVFYYKSYIKLKSLLNSLITSRYNNNSKDEELNQIDRKREKMLITNKL